MTITTTFNQGFMETRKLEKSRSKTRVLVIDDSAFVREILSKGLELDPTIEVVGTASNPFTARDKILRLEPDVITLDVEMPRMNGLEFLNKLMEQHPLPVIMVSAYTESGSKITLDALQAGAIDFVLKPSRDFERSLGLLFHEIQSKVKMAAKAKLLKRNGKRLPVRKKPMIKQDQETACRVIAIGASTGGTTAIDKVLEGLPVNSPGILVTQHMPAGFTQAFANRLNSQFDFDIREAKTGDLILPGQVLIAPGDQHMEMVRSGDQRWVKCHSGPKYKGLRPSVDMLFRSVAKHEGANAIGVMLTGMGDDGADAMLEMRMQGARTIAQDQESSVVFGMPKQAFERGGAERLVPLDKIALKIRDLMREMI